MADLVITISNTDPKFQSKLKQADANQSSRGNNGLIDTDEERMIAGNLLCAEKPKNQSAAEACLRKTLGIETANALITWEPSLFQSMDRHDSSVWNIANWANGKEFNCTWRPSNIKFEKGTMKLVLNNTGCPDECKGKPFASGEYRTHREIYRYGYYEARIKAAKGIGLVAGTFFVYSGEYGKRDHNEIDFEVLGKDPTQVQINYYYAGHGKDQQHKRMIPLGFDATADFHNYGFKWEPDAITWYIDGKPRHKATVNIPKGNTRIMANFWPGSSLPDMVAWLGGTYKYPGHPLQVEYDWIKYSPLKDAPKSTTPEKPSVQPPTTPQKPIPVKPAAPGEILNIEKIQQGSFAFNDGILNAKAGVYSFSASQAKDPGFGILTGNADLQGRNILKFEIKGNFKKLGGWARFIAQIYSDKDNDYTPSVSFDPIELKPNYTTVSVDLQKLVEKAKKVQFLLVTDKGSCKVEIKNIRFE